MKRPTLVKLVAGEKSRDFTLEEAQELIRDEAARGSINWKLPETSPFKLNNGIIERTSTEPDPKASKRSSTPKSKQAGG